MSLIKGKLDPKRCVKAVPDSGGWRWYQCRFKKKVGDYCGVHDPIKKEAEYAKKREARAAADRKREEVRANRLRETKQIIGKLAEASSRVADWRLCLVHDSRGDDVVITHAEVSRALAELMTE